MEKYKYISWEWNKKMEDIMKELTELAKEGWELDSHCQNENGMSVILERFMG